MKWRLEKKLDMLKKFEKLQEEDDRKKERARKDEKSLRGNGWNECQQTWFQKVEMWESRWMDENVVKSFSFQFFVLLLIIS